MTPPGIRRRPPLRQPGQEVPMSLKRGSMITSAWLMIRALMGLGIAPPRIASCRFRGGALILPASMQNVFGLAEWRSMSSRISRMVARWSPSWLAVIRSGPLFPTNDPPIPGYGAAPRSRGNLPTVGRIRRLSRVVEIARNLSRVPSAIFWITVFRSMASSGLKMRRAEPKSDRIPPDP